ncbi:DNA polymerase III subunit gamma/tau [Candidatus Vidania fulgoroideorum]
MFLYNKYRPKSLKNFYGHKNIIKFIKYFKKKRSPLSIIFFGPKGTGKTSLSRIYFRILNCKKKTDCRKCKNCKIPIEKNSDFKEIDAASNRKVDDIVNLLNNIEYLPINGLYKIFSIDEAQMLSRYSFNYLLKKIENLPRYSILLFLTTNIKKIPDTIISRCFVMKFKKFNSYEIFIYLKKICKKEIIQITKKSLILISNYSEGSLRNSLILLDHSKILSKKIINSKTVYKIIDVIKESLIFNFFYIFLKKKKKYINKFLIYLFLKKINIYLFLKKIIEYSNEIFFLKKNKKYCKYFLFDTYNKKYLQYFCKKKYLYKIKKIKKIILKEIDFFLKFDNYNGIKYIFHNIMKIT